MNEVVEHCYWTSQRSREEVEGGGEEDGNELFGVSWEDGPYYFGLLCCWRG